jgi:fumarate hydratase class II
VIPEAVMMVCAQVIGNDASVSIGGQHGNFQLNVMLPVIAYNLIQSITLLAKASHVLADQAIVGFTVNEERINSLVGRNPIIVTAKRLSVMNWVPDRQQAMPRSPVEGCCLEKTSLTNAELDRLLDPPTDRGGIQE